MTKSSKKPPQKVDFVVYGEPGQTVFRLQPMTLAALEWLNFLYYEPWQKQGTAVSIDHHFIVGVIERIQEAGLLVAAGGRLP